MFIGRYRGIQAMTGTDPQGAYRSHLTEDRVAGRAPESA
jgi:hypothetical protein